MPTSRFALICVASFAFSLLAGNTAPAAETIDTGDASQRGKNIQRTMRLLAESTPQKKNTVRILFYGQSITAQKWTKLVVEDLKKRFPNANIISENRALSGYASQLLSRTAETDLYPFQPDLVIFHVFGAHDKYEDIIRHVRERTTAEILQQNDHLGAKDKLIEEMDPDKNRINGGNWNGFMNFNWLPQISRNYQTEFCDQRTIWKNHLTQHKLEPQALLTDAVHLNEKGEAVMAAAVISYLRHDPKLGPSPAEAWTKDYVVGKDVSWKDGKLGLDFEGSVVELIVAAGANATPVQVSIDGKKPSELKQLYGFTRAVAKPGGHWPVIMPLHAEKLPLIEDWTMEVKKEGADDKLFSFTLSGSKTGADGEGRSDQKFVSKSGRIVIEPEDWGVAFPMGMAGLKPVPEKFTVKWSVVPWFMDTFQAPMVVEPSVETRVLLLQGLANEKHTLELTGGGESRILAIRVGKPPLKGKEG
ncbi:SGNH/GDSL hydrolase family protein [Roseimicrobium sp. ORNL1]|uniref:SGNH/GDSL hydrolase family protein n=1 Tax=Roseimicrobium sp. ORNL1 TaxID=2711231 RepID=UPI0013E17AAA|nr:SGNH/GDSL hydrolase family protein [Roseimicrobium sp. ORNL1]QIF01118.1 SGNH/GDSL hydrolase family protein [Roseimicrobium sp. ORNL1]